MAYNFYSNYPQQSQGVIWVQGLESAKAYPVGAGNSVLLMDSENQYMYIKSADNTGMPSLRTFEYTEVTEQPKVNNYVTREELEEALAKLKPKKKKIIEVEDDE